jgi:N12 class adenine-specific DNA methylase
MRQNNNEERVRIDRRLHPLISGLRVAWESAVRHGGPVTVTVVVQASGYQQKLEVVLEPESGSKLAA